MAIEATLGGVHSVVADLMRDVMEIEFLIRDFQYEPLRIEKWLNADEKTRRNEFAPVLLRSRHANQIRVARPDLHEELDYKAHSMSLHVTPFKHPLWSRGIADTSNTLADDACFWEVFEHARRFVLVADRFRRRVAPRIKGAPAPKKDLPKFTDAWRRTRQMQAIFMALFVAAQDNSTGANDGAKA